MEALLFANWYPNFREDTIESVVIPVAFDILNYLLDNSTLMLPQESHESITKGSDITDHEGEHLDFGDSEDDCPELEEPSFPVFSETLKRAIKHLGGEVFIKLNRCAPVDSSWITPTRSLKCTSIEDIYLLLKSSDLIGEELMYSKASNLNSYIVIKRWKNMHPGHEFRCFVVNQMLTAISQRDYKVYYDYIAQNKYDITEDITNFFKKKIKGNFPSDKYTFDIIRESKNNVQLIDFGPYDLKTNPCLFSWEDLSQIEENINVEESTPEFRFLGEDPGIQPNSYGNYGIPQDLRDFDNVRQNSSFVDCIIGEVQSQSSTKADS